MVHGACIDTITTLKNLSGVDRFNGLTLVVLSQRAWYSYDITATIPGNDDTIVTPLDSIGRWFKDSNTANVLNRLDVIIASTSPVILDNSNSENIQVTLNQSAQINFTASLRNGYTRVAITRGNPSNNIAGWDTRVRWGTITPLTFTAGINTVIVECLVISNLIYVFNVNSYA